MNETLKVLETRRSCRNFDKERMVSEEDIAEIAETLNISGETVHSQKKIAYRKLRVYLKDTSAKSRHSLWLDRQILSLLDLISFVR